MGLPYRFKIVDAANRVDGSSLMLMCFSIPYIAARYSTRNPKCHESLESAGIDRHVLDFFLQCYFIIDRASSLYMPPVLRSSAIVLSHFFKKIKDFERLFWLVSGLPVDLRWPAHGGATFSRHVFNPEWHRGSPGCAISREREAGFVLFACFVFTWLSEIKKNKKLLFFFLPSAVLYFSRAFTLLCPRCWGGPKEKEK